MSENSVLYEPLPVPPKQNVRPPFHVREILETIGVSLLLSQTIGACPKCLMESENAIDIVPRFPKWGNAAVFVHRPFAGVVAGKRQTHITVEIIQQPAQVLRAAVDVLLGVVRVDAEAPVSYTHLTLPTNREV
mgnify:CR=1 FL=1